MLGFDPQTGPGHEPDYFAPGVGMSYVRCGA